MRTLFYSIRYLMKGKENSLIRIFSLALGLVVGVVLFSRIAFELSYDTFYPEADRFFLYSF